MDVRRVHWLKKDHFSRRELDVRFVVGYPGDLAPVPLNFHDSQAYGFNEQFDIDYDAYISSISIFYDKIDSDYFTEVVGMTL